MIRVRVLVMSLVGAGCFTDIGPSATGASDESGATGTTTVATTTTTTMPGTTDAPLTGEAVATGVDSTSADGTSTGGETTGGSTTDPSTQPTTQPTTQTTDPSGPTTDEPVSPCGDDASLVACFRFEQLNVLLLDESVYANHAKTENVALVTGVVGMGLDVNKESIVQAPHAPQLSPGDALTYAAWISPRSLPADDLGRMMILDKDGEYAMILYAGGVACSFTPEVASVKVPVETNKWTHVACVHGASGEYRIYVNGQDVGGAVVGSVGMGVMAPLTLGHDSPEPTLKDRYDGVMDEVRIWSRDLTKDEIKALAGP
jgi:hypothetical protein